MYVLARETAKMRLSPGSIRALYLVSCPSSSFQSPSHSSSALEFPGMTMQTILSSLLTLAGGICQDSGALNMERMHGGEEGEGKCRKGKGHDLPYRP